MVYATTLLLSEAVFDFLVHFSSGLKKMTAEQTKKLVIR
jgi:hypothetical protein